MTSTYTVEQVKMAASVIETEGNDFTYGKPDERDFVRMVLRGAGLPERHNGDEWLEDVANAIYEDAGETAGSPEELAVFVLSRVEEVAPMREP